MITTLRTLYGTTHYLVEPLLGRGRSLYSLNRLETASVAADEAWDILEHDETGGANRCWPQVASLVARLRIEQGRTEEAERIVLDQ